jgi:PPK2 family polyphosphate:nucleotide phosphotransferase
VGYAVKIEPGQSVRLKKISTDADGGLTKEEGDAKLVDLTAELDELQELLYAAGTEALLVVLQGMDTSGKDGTIRRVFTAGDPQGIKVAGFKVPTERELAHDFLWRVHQETPERGMIGVFNRSYYEDVVVVRVHDLVPEAVWKRRYDQINAFERMLTEDAATMILKFYLHISKEEQERRLLAREEEVEKAWKLSLGDWKERKRWDDYMAAYDDALRKCSTAHAPWHVVPADKKWFRDLAVAEAVAETLRPRREGWLASLRTRGEDELAKIRAARASGQIG